MLLRRDKSDKKENKKGKRKMEKNKTPVTWSDKIKEIRKKQDCTQQELADKLGCDRTAVSKWESGERTPNMRDQSKIDDIYFSTINKQLTMF